MSRWNGVCVDNITKCHMGVGGVKPDKKDYLLFDRALIILWVNVNSEVQFFK